MDLMFLDKKPVGEKLPVRSMMFAEGVFETFRWKNSPPVHLDEHLDRMARGAKVLKIPFPGKGHLADVIKNAIERSKLHDAYVKVCLLSSGSKKFSDIPGEAQVMVLVRMYEPQREQLTAHVASFRRNSSSPVVRIKSTNYLENVLARREAKDLGFDEAIFLNERGEVTEGAATNLFWVKEGKLFTPAVECGLLPGITRGRLLSLAPRLGLETVEGMFGLKEVLSSYGAFLTNSLMGVAALTDVDGVKIPLNVEIFKKIRHAVFEEMKWV
ncbi:MAG: aminotransferase class IV [Candidatus Hadarchaeales archaeon]